MTATADPAERLDRVLVARRLARSRGQAVDLIAEGRVRLNGAVAAKPALRVAAGDVVEAEADPAVSRAGGKLAAALDESGTAVPARVLDAGAATGGFTQVALARGAERVYAVDVGHGQLAPALRTDPRVVSREGLNLRDLTLTDLDGQPVDLVVADVSFISLTHLLAPLLTVLSLDGTALLLVKPQFEVGRAGLGGRGVVTRPADRRQAADRVVAAAAELGWASDWRADSRRPGARGNVEHFLRLRRAGTDDGPRADCPAGRTDTSSGWAGPARH
ncbi:MAG: TlyA family RNA methyltransferase [Propionibacteriaceae bacterium]|nr:TlyA family RNA methyltransferase [Propionibacteriaceae bacterium]